MTTARPGPYVGVSGVVSPTQQEWLTGVFTRLGLFGHRRLLLGVKAVHKTQWDSTPNKYGEDWYPVGEQAFTNAVVPAEQPWLFPVAQIYLDVDFVHDPDYRTQFMDRILDRGRDWLQGIQFDLLPWHTDPAMVEFLTALKARTGLEVLVQAHGPAMESLGPEGVVKTLTGFDGAVDHVLFDASHGTGARLDAEALSLFVDATVEDPSLEGVGVAVAGGLSATTVAADLPRLVHRFPMLSWDAEGSLHPVTDAGTRPLDVARAESYLAASALVLGC